VASQNQLVKCVAIHDKKNPGKFILRIVEPLSLRGKIAFPIDFTPSSINEEYVCEVITDAEKWCKVKLHECKYELLDKYYEVNVVERDNYGFVKKISVIEKQYLRCIKCHKTKVETKVIKVVESDDEIVKEISKVIDFYSKKIKDKNYLEEVTYPFKSIITEIEVKKKFYEMVKDKEKIESIKKFYEDLKRDLEIIEKIEKLFEEFYYCEKCRKFYHKEETKRKFIEYVMECGEESSTFCEPTITGDWFRVCPQCEEIVKSGKEIVKELWGEKKKWLESKIRSYESHIIYGRLLRL